MKREQISKIDTCYENDDTLVGYIYRSTRGDALLRTWICSYKFFETPEDVGEAILDCIIESDMYLKMYDGRYEIQRMGDGLYSCATRRDIIDIFKKQNGRDNSFVEVLKDFLFEDEIQELRSIPVKFSIEEYIENERLQKLLDMFLNYTYMIPKCHDRFGVVVRNGYFHIIFV